MWAIHGGIFLAALLLHSAVPLRVLLTAFFVAVTALIVCAVIFRKTIKKNPEGLFSWILEITAILLISMLRVFNYTFPETSTTPFLIPSAIFGVAVSVFLLVKYFWKDQKFWGRVGTFFLIWLLSAFFMLSVLLHTNYVFDFSTPKEYTVVIEETDWEPNRRGPNSYDFKVTIDGETYDIDVPRRDYKQYRPGDTYRIYRYEGALGKPFYIASGWVE